MTSHNRCVAVLNSRGPDTFDEWERQGFPRDKIAPLLAILQERMDYPNRFFLPGDLLQEFVNDDTYDFSTLEIAEELANAYPGRDFWTLSFSPATTIGDLACMVLK